MDGLTLKASGLAVLLLATAACGSSGRPKHLLYGESAPKFAPVRGSVVSIGRVLPGTTLGRRFSLCRPVAVAHDALVVERIGVFGESLTFADPRHRTVYSCDGGTDPAGEHRPPWCGGSAGRLFGGRLLDSRLDIVCRDARGRPIAYAWVDAAAGAHWVGVDQGSYTELYEVLAGLPVRIATARGVHLERSSATFDVAQYDLHGRKLIEGKVEAAVAG